MEPVCTLWQRTIDTMERIGIRSFCVWYYRKKKTVIVHDDALTLLGIDSIVLYLDHSTKSKKRRAPCNQACKKKLEAIRAYIVMPHASLITTCVAVRSHMLHTSSSGCLLHVIDAVIVRFLCHIAFEAPKGVENRKARKQKRHFLRFKHRNLLILHTTNYIYVTQVTTCMLRQGATKTGK